MADTIVPAASLRRVLNGVAVATKAPAAYVEPLSTWLEQLDNVRGNDSPLGTAAADEKQDSSIAFSFSSWCDKVEACSVCKSPGVEQLVQVVLAVSLLREQSRNDLTVDRAVLDIIWSLIYDAIITSEHTSLQFTVTRSAQGFLAVPLCSLVNNGQIDELWRFHTWMPDGQRGNAQRFSIHAHQPFGQSWTLLGQGTDCTYQVDVPRDLSLATHAAYECCYSGADGQKNTSGYQTHQLSSAIRNTGRLLRVLEGETFRHSRDMSYIIPGGAYHRSIVPGQHLHSTLFVFDSQRGYDESAAVLGPLDGGENIQLRDPAGITAIALAQMANATRAWEQLHGVASYDEEEHPIVLAYYRLFRGMAHLKAGQQELAKQYLNPLDEHSPVQVLEKDPTPAHQEYVRQLVDAGWNMFSNNVLVA